MAGELIQRDGQIEFNGLLMGAGTPYRRVSLEGWHEMPGGETGNQPRPSAHGAWLGGMLAGTRIIRFTHRITSPDLPAALAALELATRMRDEEVPFVVQEAGAQRMVWARCIRRSLPMDLAYSVGLVPQAVLQFEATDPRRYSVETLSRSTRLPQPGTGFSYPLTYPLDYGEPATPGSVQCVNDGSEDSPPVVIIAGGDVPNPVVVNRTTGRRLAFDLVLTASDSLVVDTREGTVLLNGVNRAYTLAATSDDPADFVLQPGANDVDFRASGPSDTAELTMTWQHAT